MRAVGLLLLVACGRVAFDPLQDGTAIAACGGACPAGSAFCDDFETSFGTTFPRWSEIERETWNGSPLDPTTQIQTSASACAGATAAHVHTFGSGQIAMLEQTMTLPNPFYARVWFRIGGASSAEDFEGIGLHNTSSDFLHIGLMRRAQLIGINTQGVPVGIAGMQGAATLVPDRWMCLELDVRLDPGSNGAIRVALDGVTAFDVQGATQGGTPFDRLVLGTVTGNTETGTYDIEYDDLVVSALPIGCS